MIKIKKKTKVATSVDVAILNELIELSNEGSKEVEVYGSFFVSKMGLAKITVRMSLRRMRENGFISQKIVKDSYPVNLRRITVKMDKILEKLEVVEEVQNG